MYDALVLLCTGLAVLGLAELLSRAPARLAAFVFVAVSLGVVANWLILGFGTPFLFAKVLSVGFGAVVVIWLAHGWTGSKTAWGTLGPYRYVGNQYPGGCRSTAMQMEAMQTKGTQVNAFRPTRARPARLAGTSLHPNPKGFPAEFASHWLLEKLHNE